MIKFLRSHGFEVFIGSKRKLGSIYKAVNQFNPEIIYFDWVHSYLIGKTFLWSFIKSLFFVFEISYLCFFRKIPFIHTLHNTQNHGGFWLAWEQIFYGFFLRRCSKIRVYSETVKQEVVKKFRILSSDIYIIQDIPYHHYYLNNISEKESRAYFNITEKDFVYLFFGKIKKYKGLENLILAFKAVEKSGDYLLIAGECSDRKYLSQLVKLAYGSQKIILYDGFIAEDEVQYFFNVANVVVLPFTRIDHSGSIDLAMSFAKPIITLKTGTTSDLLAYQEYLLFENPQELESCMALAHKINVEEIGIENFKIVDSPSYRDLLVLFKKV
ncbi:hypothetical protein Dfri01_01220 [Dyadobacter frigoris]|nr:hypothetical protein Dfri01_01220 [Dyadobacter frigoris]